MHKFIAGFTTIILTLLPFFSIPTATAHAAVANPRQQINRISSILDGSVVYGSDATRAAALRTFSGGKLKTSIGNLLPFNTAGLPNANDAHILPNDQLFLAGDVRANENVELSAVQTLFIREHNHIADLLAAKNPSMSDEEIYQRARQVVIAEIEVITYKEFLPALLGSNALKGYRGYSSATNPSISTEFSSAAYRIGHTLVNDDVEFLGNDGNSLRAELDLASAFFDPRPLIQSGIDPVLKYLATDNASEVDLQIVDPLRNFLFGPPGAGGFDLASMNIQRGRDHGLADYNTTRSYYGLPKVKDFSEITKNVDIQNKLKNLYGTVNNIDLWVGGLAEDHPRGSSVGPTFSAIIADQFDRSRTGDFYWYERNFTGKDRNMLEKTELSDIIIRNTDLTNIQSNVFFFKAATTTVTWKTKKNSPDYTYDLAMSRHAEYQRSYNGAGANPDHPTWGMAGTDLLRLAPAAYGDGYGTPAGADRPSARLISNTLDAQTTEDPNDRSMSDWVYAWGQFIDHDLDLTDQGHERMDISIPAGDPYFDPSNTGTQIIPFTRSYYDEATGI
jgi:peroxidase